MSIEALRWALEIGEERDLEPTQRHILLILGNRADEVGFLYPSITWICNRTGLSRRTVQINCTSMEKAGLFMRAPRTNGSGERTSDAWQLAMSQPGLPLVAPRALNAPPPAPAAPPPRTTCAPRGAADAPNTQELKQEEKTTTRGGRATPTPVAAAFQAYQQGIKARYQADYPPSARANGQLANVVGRVGRDLVVPVVSWYLAHQDPFYGKTKHALDYLVRDCAKFALEVQASSHGEVAAPTHARVGMLGADGKLLFECPPYPAGQMDAIAKKAITDYASRVRRHEPRYIAVRQGTERRQFSLEELNT